MTVFKKAVLDAVDIQFPMAEPMIRNHLYYSNS